MFQTEYSSFVKIVQKTIFYFQCIKNSFKNSFGEFKITDEKHRVTELLQKAYHAYFGVQFGDQDKLWAPHVVCKTYVLIA